MGRTIHISTEPVYRDQLQEELKRQGYNTKLYEQKSGLKSNDLIDSAKGLILQANLWPKTKQRLRESMPVVLFGLPAWFYCWLEARLKRNAAYLTPYDVNNSIGEALANIQRDSCYLSESVKKMLCLESRERQQKLLNVTLRSHLTMCELEVLFLISEGLTSSEIARERIRSVHTIKTQRKNIRKKLQSIEKEPLAVFAARNKPVLKTLMMIEQNRSTLSEVCKNRS